MIENAAARENDSLKPEAIGYIVEIYNMYISHLGSLFNYFSIFAALVVNAVVMALLDEGAQELSAIIYSILIFGVMSSLIFFGLDFRTRQIIAHIENSLERIEELYIPSGISYLRGIPRAKFRGLAKNGVLFPAMYICFGALMVIIIFRY